MLSIDAFRSQLKSEFPYLHECDGKWIGSALPTLLRCLSCGLNEHLLTA